MGNKHSLPTRNINHHIFNIQDNNIIPSSCDFMKTLISVPDQKIFQQWKNKLTQTNSLNEQNLLLPKNYQLIKRYPCSQSGILHVEYDNYPYLLHDQIKHRQQKNKQFEQFQIWFLLYNLVWSAIEFYTIQQKLGDVRPHNIFINQIGQIKTVCLYSWPGELTNYQKTLLNGQITFLAPQQLNECQFSRSKPASDPQKAQSFSIGLTVLSTIMVTNMEILYQKQKYSLDKQLLKKIIEEMFKLELHSQCQKNKNKYSHSLVCAIASLCEIDPSKRMTVTECYKWLSQYQIDILYFNKVNIKMLQRFKKYQIFQMKHNRTKSIKQQIFGMHNQTVKQIHKLPPKNITTPIKNNHQQINYSSNQINTTNIKNHYFTKNYRNFPFQLIATRPSMALSSQEKNQTKHIHNFTTHQYSPQIRCQSPTIFFKKTEYLIRSPNKQFNLQQIQSFSNSSNYKNKSIPHKLGHFNQPNQIRNTSFTKQPLIQNTKNIKTNQQSMPDNYQYLNYNCTLVDSFQKVQQNNQRVQYQEKTNILNEVSSSLKESVQLQIPLFEANNDLINKIDLQLAKSQHMFPSK